MARKPSRNSNAGLVDALARGQSVAQAARSAGISVRTAFRRLEDQGFQREVRTCREKMFDEATGALAATTKKAAKTLCKLLDDESSTIRLSAAKAVLESAQRLREALDIEHRLAAVETILEGAEL